MLELDKVMLLHPRQAVEFIVTARKPSTPYIATERKEQRKILDMVVVT